MQLVYFSPVNWTSYFQRPHYMIQYFLNADEKNRVLWFEPYPSRFPTGQDFSRLRKKIKTTMEMPKANHLYSRLKVVRVSALPIEPLKFSEKINGVLFWQNILTEIESFWAPVDSNDSKVIGFGKPSQLALFVLKNIQKNHLKRESIKTFYDAMDDFPEFHHGMAKQMMKETEAALSQKVDMVTVSSTGLLEKFPKALKIFNGYPMASLPDIKQKKKNARFVLGYIGTLGKWFDWDCVIRLARWFPEGVVRLIGPEYIQRPKGLPKNIEFFPECPQSKAIDYLKEFDVGLVPFKKNHLTTSVDPIKYYEYRAMGLPVISTRFGEMQYRDFENDAVIFFEDLNSENSVEKIKNANLDNATVNQFRLENDWNIRFQPLYNALK